MKTKSLQILEKAQLPSQQARAILEVMEAELSTDQLASKDDVRALKDDVQALKVDFRALKEDFRALRDDVFALKADLQHLEATLKAYVDSKIEAAKSELVRWLFVVILGQSATFLGIAYFMAAHFRR